MKKVIRVTLGILIILVLACFIYLPLEAEEKYTLVMHLDRYRHEQLVSIPSNTYKFNLVELNEYSYADSDGNISFSIPLDGVEDGKEYTYTIKQVIPDEAIEDDNQFMYHGYILDDKNHVITIKCSLVNDEYEYEVIGDTNFVNYLGNVKTLMVK